MKSLFVSFWLMDCNRTCHHLISCCCTSRLNIKFSHFSKQNSQGQTASGQEKPLQWIQVWKHLQTPFTLLTALPSDERKHWDIFWSSKKHTVVHVHDTKHTMSPTIPNALSHKSHQEFLMFSGTFCQFLLSSAGKLFASDKYKCFPDWGWCYSNIFTKCLIFKRGNPLKLVFNIF